MSEPQSTAGRLSAAEKVELTKEIVGAYFRIRRLIRRADLQQVLQSIRLEPRASRSLPLSRAGDSARLGRVVGRALRPIPADTRCLTRSLVLLSLLSRRGIVASLVIAVRPGTGLSLDAHAWVETDGNPVLEPAGAGHGRLVTL